MKEEEARFEDPSDERFVKFITSIMAAVIASEPDSTAMFGGRHQLSFSGLTYVLAMMMEANSGSKTKRDIRQDAEGLARALRIQAVQRDNQDESVATIKMRIGWGCGGAGRSP